MSTSDEHDPAVSEIDKAVDAFKQDMKRVIARVADGREVYVLTAVALKDEDAAHLLLASIGMAADDLLHGLARMHRLEMDHRKAQSIVALVDQICDSDDGGTVH